MRVFVTGAHGFIGRAVVQELQRVGHSVMGLARSSQAENILRHMHVEPRRGDLEDGQVLRKAASESDGVIHLAFMHGLSKASLSKRIYVLCGGAPADIVKRFLTITTEADRYAIDAMAAGLEGSGRPLITTFGTLGLANTGLDRQHPFREEDRPDPLSPGFGRATTESIVDGWAQRGVRAMIVRLPPTVHGDGDSGFVPQLIAIARKKKCSAYIGEGCNRWPAVHRRDAAALFRLALEKGLPGAHYHGVAEEGVAFRDIAQTIGARLNVPVVSRVREEAARQFGWLGPFVCLNNPTSSRWTREQLGWRPQGPTLTVDIDRDGYFKT